MEYYIQAEPGVNIFVSDINPSGTKTILFIHGWPLNHRAYEYQIDQLPAMGYRCVCMDTRGFGNSDKPWGGYDYDRLADDVKAVIDQLELHHITLIGHSMGGAIAVRYMGRHNGHGVSRLILLAAAAPSFVKRPGFPYGLSKEDVDQFIDTAYNDRPKLLRTFGEMFFFQYVTPPLAEWFFDLGLQASGWATAKCLVTLRDEVLFQDLRRICVPTLIIQGVHDKVCLYPLALAQKQEIRNARLVSLDYSGHGAFYEQRDKVNKLISEFALRL